MEFETVRGLITINATLPLQILHFLILMFILDRILFKPVMKIMAERRKFIEDKRKELEKIKEEAERLKDKFLKIETEAKLKAAQERAGIREEGLREAEKILEKSRKEVSVIKEEAEKRIREQIEKVRPSLEKQAQKIAEEIIKKITVASLILLIFPSICLSAKTAPSKARIIYNNIMLFVNFGIIVFLFIRYGKRPLLEFLKNERDKIQGNISKLEEEYNRVKKEIEEQREKISNAEVYAEQIRESILEMAKREKEKIIEDAKKEAQKMIEDANLYYKTELEKAKRMLSDEMMNMAIAVVEERLRKELSKEMNEKIIDRFIKDIQKI